MSDKETKFEHNVKGSHFGDNYSAHTQNIFYGTNPSEDNTQTNVETENETKEVSFSDKIIIFISVGIMAVYIFWFLAKLAFVFYIPWIVLFSFIYSRINEWYRIKEQSIMHKVSLITLKIILLLVSSYCIFDWWHHGYATGNLDMDIFLGFLGLILILVLTCLVFVVYFGIRKKFK